MKIRKENFRYTRDLVKLDFSNEEETKLIKDLNQMIGFIDTMNEFNTDDVEPMTYIHMMNNRYREDVAADREIEQEHPSNTREGMDGCYVVPRILE